MSLLLELLLLSEYWVNKNQQKVPLGQYIVLEANTTVQLEGTFNGTDKRR